MKRYGSEQTSSKIRMMQAKGTMSQVQQRQRLAAAAWSFCQFAKASAQDCLRLTGMVFFRPHTLAREVECLDWGGKWRFIAQGLLMMAIAPFLIASVISLLLLAIQDVPFNLAAIIEFGAPIVVVSITCGLASILFGGLSRGIAFGLAYCIVRALLGNVVGFNQLTEFNDVTKRDFLLEISGGIILGTALSVASGAPVVSPIRTSRLIIFGVIFGVVGGLVRYLRYGTPASLPPEIMMDVAGTAIFGVACGAGASTIDTLSRNGVRSLGRDLVRMLLYAAAVGTLVSRQVEDSLVQWQYSAEAAEGLKVALEIGVALGLVRNKLSGWLVGLSFGLMLTQTSRFEIGALTHYHLEAVGGVLGIAFVVAYFQPLLYCVEMTAALKALIRGRVQPDRAPEFAHWALSCHDEASLWPPTLLRKLLLQAGRDNPEMSVRAVRRIMINTFHHSAAIQALIDIINRDLQGRQSLKEIAELADVQHQPSWVASIRAEMRIKTALQKRQLDGAYNHCLEAASRIADALKSGRKNKRLDDLAEARRHLDALRQVAQTQMGKKDKEAFVKVIGQWLQEVHDATDRAIAAKPIVEVPTPSSNSPVSTHSTGTYLEKNTKTANSPVQRGRMYSIFQRRPVARWSLCGLTTLVVLYSLRIFAGPSHATAQPVLDLLMGHSSLITCLSFSPSGEVLASGSRDERVCLWDVPFGRPKMVLPGTEGATGVLFSPDGSTLVTYDGQDSELQVWNAADGELRATLNNDGDVKHATFATSGTILATYDHTGTARLWDVETGQRKVILPTGEPNPETSADRPELFNTGLPSRYNLSFAFSSDLKVLAAKEHVWGLTSGHKLSLEDSLDLSSEALAISPDGRVLAAPLRGHEDDAVGIWDVRSGQHLFNLPGKTRKPAKDVLPELASGLPSQAVAEVRLRALAFSPNGKFLVGWWPPNPGFSMGEYRYDIESQRSSLGSREAWLWNIKTRQRRILRGGASHILMAHFSPKADILATRAVNGTITLWDVRTGQVKEVFEDPATPTLVNRQSPDHIRYAKQKISSQSFTMDIPSGVMAFSHDGKTMAIGSRDGTIYLWNVGDRANQRSKLMAKLQGHAGPTDHVHISPDARRVAALSKDGRARLWDMETGRLVQTLHGNATEQSCMPSCIMNFSPDGKYLVTCGDNASVRLWDADGNPRKVFKKSWDVFKFSLDATLLATSGPRGSIKVWNIDDDHAPLAELPSNGFEFSPREFSSREALVVVNRWPIKEAGQPGAKMWLWDIHKYPKGEKLTHLKPGSTEFDELRQTAFSRDGQMFAAATANAVWLWDLRSAQAKPEINGFQLEDSGMVADLEFSPNGELLALGGGTSVLVWNVREREWEREMKESGSIPDSHKVAFINDSILASRSDRLRVWNIRTGCQVWQPEATILSRIPAEVRYRFEPSAGSTMLSESWTNSTLAQLVPLPPMTYRYGTEQLNYQGEGWLAITPQGYYSCSKGADDQFLWHRGDKTALRFRGGDSASDQFLRQKGFAGPDLASFSSFLNNDEYVALALSGVKIPQPVLPKYPVAPAARIITPTPDELRNIHGDSLKVQVMGQDDSDIRRCSIFINDNYVKPTSESTGDLESLDETVSSRRASTLGDVRSLRTVPIYNESSKRYKVSKMFTLYVPLPKNKKNIRLSAKVIDNEGISSKETEITTPQAGVLHVLAIGVNRYDKWKGLRYAIQDASSMIATLSAQKGRMYADVKLYPLVNEPITRREVIRELAKIRKAIQETPEKDTVIVYLAGHGGKDRSGNYYFAMRDTDPTDPSSTALTWPILRKELSALQSQRLLIFVDTCYSGDLTTPLTDTWSWHDTEFGGLSSSTGYEATAEWWKWGGSPFAMSLREVFEKGAGDYSKDQVIQWDELQGHIARRVKMCTQGRQTVTVLPGSHMDILSDIAVAF